jgi:hypothetical protein
MYRQDHPFLISTLQRWIGVRGFTRPGRFTPAKERIVPTECAVCWAPEPIWFLRRGNNLFVPTENRTRFV